MVIAAGCSAIDIGYRHFDTSPLYNTEKPLGVALKTKIDEGVVKREELFIGSKVVSKFLLI